MDTLFFDKKWLQHVIVIEILLTLVNPIIFIKGQYSVGQRRTKNIPISKDANKC